jgi:hypothetical protein
MTALIVFIRFTPNLQAMKRPLPLFLSVMMLLTVCAFSTLAQDCDCDHIISPPSKRTTTVFVDGESIGVRPGESICLKAGFYMQIRFLNIFGQPGKPVTIKNCGGQVLLGDSLNYGRWYAADIVNCKYIRMTGTGDPGLTYGITLGKSGDSALKIGGLSTDTEIDHLEIANAGFAGILAKTDFGGTPPPGTPEMNNVNIHDNYIHDTKGEGMYIGETKTPGQDFRHLEVWNNIVTRTGYELIQVANAVEDVRVHNNVLYRSGTRNVLYQNKGFQIGDNAVGDYYNNFIFGGPSNAMVVMGAGNINIFNNYLQHAEDAAFFIDNRSVTLPQTAINIRNNFIMDVSAGDPFFTVYNELNQVNITDNRLDSNNVLLTYGSGAGQNVKESGNSVGSIERVQFMDSTSHDFRLAPGSPYQGIGLIENPQNLNARPYVALIPDANLTTDRRKKFTIEATDPDGDAMVLEAFNLPEFASFQDKGNGAGIFTFAPALADTGVYFKVRVRVTDARGSMNSQNFTVTVTPSQKAPIARTPSTPMSRESHSLGSIEGVTTENVFDQESAYPNPAADRLILDLGTGDRAQVNVGLYDHTGKSIYQNSWTNADEFIQLDLDAIGLEPGIYFLKVKQSGLPLRTTRLVKD